MAFSRSSCTVRRPRCAYRIRTGLGATLRWQRSVLSGQRSQRAIAHLESRIGPAASGKIQHANYRGLGLADMARGIMDNRPHRANGDVAIHVLAIMEGILSAAAEKRGVEIAPSCMQPEPLNECEALGLLPNRD